MLTAARSAWCVINLLISWFRAGAITKFGMENLCVSSVLTTLALGRADSVSSYYCEPFCEQA
jgi:hypothetical protein